MPRHPSLDAEVELPPPLEPQRVMEPYVPCWCRSGKKWKFCHKDRQKQEPINIFDHTLRIRREFNRGYCSHPEAGPSTCSRKIIHSHTIQKNGGIINIADSGHHVISFKIGFENIAQNNGEIKPGKIGYNIASTFMGFCAEHDSELFKEIENAPFSLNTNSAYLLAFRSIAYELYQKRMSLNLEPIFRELDNGKPFESQAAIQQYLNVHFEGVRRGAADVQKVKNIYDAAFLSKNFDDFGYYAIQFPNKFPIVSCGAFLPEFDFQGNALQVLVGPSCEYQHVCFNLTIINGATIAVFGWLKGTPGASLDFVRSFRKIPDEHKANALFVMAFEHLENTYARPDWWESQPDANKNYVINKTQSGLGAFSPERIASCLNYLECELYNSPVGPEIFSSDLTI